MVEQLMSRMWFQAELIEKANGFILLENPVVLCSFMDKKILWGFLFIYHIRMSKNGYAPSCRAKAPWEDLHNIPALVANYFLQQPKGCD